MFLCDATSLQPVVLIIPVHCPPISPLFFLHRNQAFFSVQREPLFVILGPIPRPDHMPSGFSPRAIPQFSRLPVRKHPVEFWLLRLVFAFCDGRKGGYKAENGLRGYRAVW